MLTNLLLKLLDNYDTIKNILKNICMYKKNIKLYKIFQLHTNFWKVVKEIKINRY